jgi:hypothetical protein
MLLKGVGFARLCRYMPPGRRGGFSCGNIRCGLPTFLFVIALGGVAPAVVLAPIDGRARCGGVMIELPDRRAAFVGAMVAGGRTTRQGEAVSSAPLGGAIGWMGVNGLAILGLGGFGGLEVSAAITRQTALGRLGVCIIG